MTPLMDLSWYCVHTKPRQEERVGNSLRARNIETLTPKIREKSARQFSGQGPRYVVKPLFPSYVFARFSLAPSLHRVCFVRGVHSVISFGGRPCRVDNAIIDLIQAREDEEGFVDLTETLRPGDKVVVQGGPFNGSVGILDKHHTSGDRVSILLLAVSYQSHILVDRAMAMKIG